MKSAPIRSSRSALVIEVVKDINEPAHWWQVLLSLPGHPGVFTKTWHVPQGRLDVSQFRDLVSWLELSIENTLLAQTGIQYSLWEEYKLAVARRYDVDLPPA